MASAAAWVCPGSDGSVMYEGAIQDLIVAAVRDATRKAGELASAKMAPLTGGLGTLGGLGIPGL